MFFVTVQLVDSAMLRGHLGIEGLVLVDMMDALCPPHLDACPPVIGNVLIYRQGSHITATYAGTLTRRLAHALDKAHVFD